MYKTKIFFGKTFDEDNLFQIDIEDNFHTMLSKRDDEVLNIVVVGAWHGDEIQSFLRLENTHIWAFEPNPINFSYLSKRYSSNPHVTCFDFACGENEGVVPLYEANLTGNDSLLPIRDGAHIQIKKVHMVDVKRLDSIKEIQNIKIDLLWVDAQGYELPIIKGSTTILKNIQSMFLEINVGDDTYAGATQASDLEKFLDTNGFNIAYRGVGNDFFLRKDINSDFFSNEDIYNKRITASLERRIKMIRFANSPFYRWLSILIPSKLRAVIKRIFNI